jgi:predicted enzyme related to lactoylglutathione lyase
MDHLPKETAMSNKTPSFVWYDLMTTDTDAAAKFYESVIGWKASATDATDNPYFIFSSGETGVGGMMLIDATHGEGMTPGWNGYVWVDNVDTTTAKVLELGGKLWKGPQDIPGIGRFAVLSDPQGAVFLLFKDSGGPARADVPAGTPGQVGWHELYASDLPKALDFYRTLFGWTPAQAIDMGEMGVYQTFATGAEPVGGMMNMMPQMPHPYWLYYVNVDAIDAAIQRIEAGGGKVIMGPHQVPTGSWIVNATDPQGAMFALVAPVR